MIDVADDNTVYYYYRWAGKHTRETEKDTTILSGSEFGNYLAGYGGYYQGGKLGLGLALMGGDYYAQKQGKPEDDLESKNNILQGGD